MAHDIRRFWKRATGLDGQPQRRGSKRRVLPMIESLEGRLVPAMSVDFAGAIAVTGSGSVDVESNSVFNDSAGNVYITGSLQGTVDFDPSSGVTNLTSTGGRDSFLAKYSKTGALLWAKDIRGSGSSSVAQGSAITVDASGNVIVTGTFTGSFNFDPSTGNTTLSASNRNDVYIAKYSSSGGLVWAKQVVGSGNSFDQGYAVAVDGSGNIAVGGTFQGAATFGSTTVNAGGSSESFATKLDTNGNFSWTRVTNGSGSSIAQTSGIAFDGSGNVVMTGFYSGTVDFNPVGSSQVMTGVGSRDIFVQKFDTSGTLAWIKTIGSTDIDQGNGIATDSSGNVYVTGTFSSTADFDPGSGVLNLTAGGFEDGFLLKLTSSGTLGWAKDLATSGYNAAQGTGIALDGSGNLFVAGYYQGTLTLASNQSITSAGSYDVFLGQYDTSGNYLASQSYGGSGFDADFGIGVNTTGQVALAGRYTGPATFGSNTLPSQTNKSIFVAQVSTATVTTPAPPAAPSTPALAPSSDTGSSNSDNITNAANPVFNINTAVASNTVRLFRDGVAVATRTGPGAITDPGPISEGTHVYTAIQVDSFNQASNSSLSVSVKFDYTSPAAPSTPALLSADDSGTVGDRITNVKQPRLTGTAEAGSTVQLLNASNTVIATATADPSTGAYTLKPTSNLADGTYSFKVQATDTAGNTGTASTSLSLTIDTTPPATPPAPTLFAADDSGVSGDGITNVKQPRLAGTTEAGSTVQLLNASNTVIATATADSSTGAYILKPSTNLADGTYSFRVQATDAAGNTGSAGASFSLTIDSTPPAAPATPTLLAADDSGTVGDRITNVKQPRLTGTAEAGSTVQLLNASNVVIATATADPSTGAYTLKPTSNLADGTYSLRVQATDAAGNTGTASTSFSLTIDSTPPATPSAPTLFAADDSGVSGDGITNVKQPRLVGTAEAGSTVQLLNASNTVIATAAADPSTGAYTLKPTSNLADGTYSFRVQATDTAGNTGTASSNLSLTIDSTAPATPSAPTLFAADDSGVSGDGITNVKQPRLVGTAEAGSTVQLLNASNTVIATATADPSTGAYTLKPTSNLADGTYSFRVQATDAAGNTGTASTSLSITIDSTAPATPSAPTLFAADDSGVSGDGITNVKQPRLVGTAEVGSTVQLLNASNVVIATAAADPSTGAYTLKPTSNLADGTYSLRVQATDAAGNTGTASTSLSITIDSTAPAAPSAPTLLAADDSGVSGDGITNVKQPRLVGTAEAGSTVQLLNASNTVIATATADPSTGAYTLKPTSNLADGTYSFKVQATDTAGNTGTASTSLSITIDSTPPATPPAPTLFAADDSGVSGDGITNVKQPRLVGTAEAGSTVQLLNASNTVIATATADPSTGAYTLKPTSNLADGTYSLRVQATDAAGNTGATSATFSLVINSTAPATPSAPALLAADDSGTVGDNLTNVNQPRLTGSASGVASVQFLNASGTVIGSGTVSNNAYTVALSSALADGTTAIRVQTIDVVGNLSSPSAPLSLTIDTKAPAIPSTPTLLAADDSGTVGDGITNVNQPRFTGTAEPFSTVQLTSANVVIGTTTAAADGTFTVKPTNPITNLISSFRVQAVDAAGNVGTGSSSVTIYIDTVAPAAPSTPSLLASDDTGTVGDGVTSTRQPTLTGTAEANSTVKLLDPSNNVLGTGTANGSGNYSIKINTSLADGSYTIRAQATDAAGNTGSASPAFALTISNGPAVPASPSTPILFAADDSGIKGDNLTNVNKPRLTGTATANNTVQIVNASGTVLGSSIAGSDGTYSVTFATALPNGSTTVQTRLVDNNGNLSANSGSLTITIDTVAPSQPGAPSLLTGDDSGTKGDGITNNNQPRIVATGEAGSTAYLLNAAGTTIGTAAVAQNGAVSVSPATTLADGTYALSIRLMDAAGNTSTTSTPFSLTIDTKAPSAPAIPALYAADDSGTVGDNLTNVAQPRLSTTAEAGSTLKFINTNGNVLATGTVKPDGTILLQLAGSLADGTYSIQASATDAAGNTSPVSPALTLTISTAGPATPLAPLLNSADDTGVIGDGKTSNRKPRFVGTTVPGVTVELLNSSNTVIATTKSSATDGSYTLQTTANLSVGTANYTVRIRNAAGNTAVSNGALTLSIVDATAGDFDGDGKSDLGIFRQSTAQWIVQYSGGSGGLTNRYGATNLADIPVSGDFDGTGKVIQGVFRPSTAQWIINSPTGERVISFGATNLADIPVPGDYDGVGYTELAVYRPSTSQWFVLGPNGGHLLGVFGAPGTDDIPAPGDYDGSGKTEMAVFRKSTAQWFYASATGGKLLGVFGATGGVDVPVPGDYDGIGQTQLAVFRPSTAQWFALAPTGGHLLAVYGATNYADLPVETATGFLKAAGLITSKSAQVVSSLSIEADSSSTANAAGSGGVDSSAFANDKATQIAKAREARRVWRTHNGHALAIRELVEERERRRTLFRDRQIRAARSILEGRDAGLLLKRAENAPDSQEAPAIVKIVTNGEGNAGLNRRPRS